MADYYSGPYLTALKTKKGGYRAVLQYRDASGKRRQIGRNFAGMGKRESKRAAEEWKQQQERIAKQSGTGALRTSKGDNSITQVVSRYLESQINNGEIERSTYSRQKTTLKIYITPYIGDYVFTDINRLVLEDWLSKLHQRGLKENTIHTTFALLNKVYNEYAKRGEISHNPCQYVKTPKKGDTKITYMDDDQVLYLLDCRDAEFEEGSELWTVIALALYGGLRRGEICGLRWFDVNLGDGRLTISSAIGVAPDENGNTCYTKGPKNKTSARTFPMIQPLSRALQSRLDYVKRKYGTVDPTWFVVGDTIHYKPPTTLASEFGRFVRKYDIREHFGRYITLHTLRHNLATVGVKSGMDIASLTQIMGHASKAMTLDTYSSAMPDALELAAYKLGESMNYETDAPEDQE